jgi:D-alanine-D-alanine ligase
MNVLVLLGGSSGEREVSLRSGKAVAEALVLAGHNVEQYDPADGYAGLADFVGKVDAVFPILHGKGGEDGELQAELEKLGFKYLGADAKASALCFDKVEFKKILNKLSILTPEGKLVTREEFIDSKLSKSPFVLKPLDGGSTIDTYIIRHPESEKVDLEVFDRYQSMLLEELIEGDEITVPVLGTAALPVIEIIPPEGKEFDYENKYNGATQEICPPVNVTSENQAKAQAIAEQVHQAAGVRHLSRTDIIIDKDNNHYVLELNTIPGMTGQSLFPNSAKVAGYTMEELVGKFLQMVLASLS